MKKLLCFFLSVFLLIPISGCQRRDHNNSHVFYYPRHDYGYNAQEGKFYENMIATEIREDLTQQTVSEIISIYLEGPMTHDFSNPYPEKLSLETVAVERQTLQITVSDHLSELTGIQLMIACACLGKTGMELTNTTAVQIACKKALLDGKKTITLYNDQIIIKDMAPDATYEQE